MTKVTPPHVRKESFHCKPNEQSTSHLVLLFLPILLGLAVAVIYYGELQQMVTSNNLSRESLESVQRAFINFNSVVMQRETSRLTSGDIKQMQFKAHWDNSGTTPGIGVIQYFNGGALLQGPNENQFIGADSFRSAPADYTIGPKATLSSGPIYTPESAIVGDAFEKPLAKRINTTVPVGYVFWGWIVYRDIFKNTRPHVTEFCEELATVYFPDEPNVPIDFVYNLCPRHNCVDEYCDDYQQVVDVATAFSPNR